MWSDLADFPQQVYIFFPGRSCSSNDEIEASFLDELQYGSIVWRMHNAPLFRVENPGKRFAYLSVCVHYECALKANWLRLWLCGKVHSSLLHSLRV